MYQKFKMKKKNVSWPQYLASRDHRNWTLIYANTCIHHTDMLTQAQVLKGTKTVLVIWLSKQGHYCVLPKPWFSLGFTRVSLPGNVSLISTCVGHVCITCTWHTHAYIQTHMYIRHTLTCKQYNYNNQ